MNPSVVANSIVDICGAIGVAVTMLTLVYRDPRGPLTSRFTALLGSVSLLFLLRGFAWWLEPDLLDRLSFPVAAAIPLGALLVTEGALRRHAPRSLKLAALTGAMALGIGGALGLGQISKPYLIGLASFQVMILITCGMALISRDRCSLTPQENLMIGRLSSAAFFILPFLLTDFQSLFPDLPVHFGPIGTLLLLTLVLKETAGEARRWQGSALMAVRLGGAACLGMAAAFMSPPPDGAQILRYVAIAIAGVLTIGMMVDALRRLFQSRTPGVLASIAASTTRLREAAITELSEHPLFAKLERYREAELAPFDPEIIRSFFASRRIVRRSDAPWRAASSDPAVERVISLMTRSSATHLIVIDHAPLDVLAVTIPVVSADPATETALALVSRILALSSDAPQSELP